MRECQEVPSVGVAIPQLPLPVSVALVDHDAQHRAAIAGVICQTPRIHRVEMVAHPRHLPPFRGDWVRVVVLNLFLDEECEESSLVWIQRLHQRAYKVVLCVESNAPRHVQEAISAGAEAVVHRREGAYHLLSVIEHLADGQPTDLGEIARALLSRQVDLTPTQVQILELVRAGLDNRSIAQHLHYALPTVNNNISAAIAKFRASGFTMHGSKPRVDLGEAARAQGIRRLTIHGAVDE